MFRGKERRALVLGALAGFAPYGDNDATEVHLPKRLGSVSWSFLPHPDQAQAQTQTQNQLHLLRLKLCPLSRPPIFFSSSLLTCTCAILLTQLLTSERGRLVTFCGLASGHGSRVQGSRQARTSTFHKRPSSPSISILFAYLYTLLL